MLTNCQLPIAKGFKLGKFSLTLLGICIAVACGTKPTEAVTLDVVASGLDNPRRMAFGPDGALYVAESGIGGPGPTVLGPELNSILSFGTTGAVTRVQNGTQERVISNLPSTAILLEGTTPPQTEGSILASNGVQDIGFDRNGNPYAIVGFATTTDQQPFLDASGGGDLGDLLSFDINDDGSWEKNNFSVDLVDFEEANNPDNAVLLNNPYDLEAQGDTLYVVDAGANNFYSIDRAGNISLETVFFPEIVDGIPIERVPTSLAVGPDGAFYVGEFTGNAAQPGSARIYRITPGDRPEIIADGFTQIIGLDFDSEGNLYVLEFSANGLPYIPPAAPTNNLDPAFTGALIQVSPDGVRRTLIGPGEGLVAPGGLSVGPDEAVYVSNFGTTVGTGQVIRVDPKASVPESSSVAALLAVSTLGIVWLQKPNPKKINIEQQMNK
jgi:hypothetical protein